ncbi:hypothetical protein AB835_03995 [Candidatus Endobugula sertula]|uniref:Fibronectin type-III domain-containing protein n=1 Tax=Candidatus Endobugula sertula TaxID=62101 RepID=A0A1D2QS20_9GAMM|nr:hypothetical protein AB835_03995 [Candidatus Endobugula sertula]
MKKNSYIDTNRRVFGKGFPLFDFLYLCLFFLMSFSVYGGAVLSNGTTQIGVNNQGHLISSGVGLRYLPTGGEALTPGCDCEGWGVADINRNLYAKAGQQFGIRNIVVESFESDGETATSVVIAAGIMRITHDYRPSDTDHLYSNIVIVENISSQPIDLRYRRAMDWDVPPTAFSEMVTIVTNGASKVYASSDNGFMDGNPLMPITSKNFFGEAVDNGPADHGAVFDFAFGELAPGEQTEFVIYYGAASNESDALEALSIVGAEVYSLGKPNPENSSVSPEGEPNTFIFGFGGVGGTPIYPHPEEVAVTQAENNEVTLSWTLPDDVDGISRYRIYQSDTPITDVTDMTAVTVVNKNSSTVTLDGLTNGKAYHFAVTTVNISGYEIKQASSVFATPIDTLPPNLAKNFNATLVGDDSVELSWETPDLDPEDINKYQLLINGELQEELDSSVFSYDIENMDLATNYSFELISIDAVGNANSGVTTSITTAYPNPENFNVLRAENNRVELQWLLPNKLDGVDKYRVYISGAEITDITGLAAHSEVDKNQSIVTISGLNNAQTYYFAITTVNVNGYEIKQVSSVIAIPVDTIPPNNARNFTADLVDASDFSLSWLAPAVNPADVNKYQLFINNELQEEFSDTTLSYNLTGLDLATTYLLKLISVDRAGNVSSGVDVIIATPYPNPTGLTVTSELNNSVGLAWSPVTPLEGVDKYRIYVSDTPITDVSGLSVYQEVNKNQSATTVSGLNNAQTYYFAVTTVNTSSYEIKQTVSVSATPVDTIPPNNARSFTGALVGDSEFTLTWQAPASNPEDVQQYQLLVNGQLQDTFENNVFSYSFSGLSIATVYSLELISIDAAGNVSNGIGLQVATPYPNPSGLHVTDESNNRVDLSWDGVENLSGVNSYKIYVSEEAFSVVDGLSPYATLTNTTASTSVGGLTNFTDYYFAVTVVNISNHEVKEVVSIKGTPSVETDGPAISTLRYGEEIFVDGFTAANDAVICAQLTDVSTISRAEFYIDSQLVSTDSNGSDDYCYSINVKSLTDGAHAFEIKAYDVYENTNSQILTFTIQLAPPAAPSIVSPADGYETNKTRVDIVGETIPGLDIRLQVNGVDATWQPVNATGRFTQNISLAEGTNTIVVKARNRSGEGDYSSPITITLDTSLPSQPIGLRTTSLNSGQVRLQWSIDTQAEYTGFNLYRSESPFEDTASAIKVNNDLITGATFNDVLFEDGTYYYRVVSVNNLGTESEPSSSISVIADSTPPIAEFIEYSTDGAFDSETQTYGRGVLNIVLTVNEPLITTPFFSIAPENGSPISIPLTLVTGEDQQYQGSVLLDENVQSGIAYAVFSGRDRFGNRGTTISAGEQINIDTAGPRVTSIVHTPATPIQNDEANPVTVSVTIVVDEALPAGETPILQYSLNHTTLDPITIDGLSNTTDNEWVGEFVLSSDAGLAQPENLSFSFSATDALGNVGTEIETAYITQVYQGDLPPLAAPFNFRGRPLSEGRVQLDWFAVADAIAYQLYRKAPGESELTAYQRLDIGDSFIDETDVDGEYQYSLASIRQDNGQEALSAQSDVVTIVADSEAPAAPANLTVELFPIGIQTAWNAVSGSHIRYRLYRAESGPILSTEGLTPLLDNLIEPFVVDTQASQQYPAYAVVAVDDYGNESEPSNTAYLNVDLLPVASMKVRVDDSATPQLEWTHSRDTINQFDLYLGQDESGVKLNTSVLTQTSYTDTGYGNNERQYAVVAIDSNNQRSLARALTLPNVTMSILSDQVIKRNLINSIDVSVTNHSVNAVSHARIKLISPEGTFQSSKVTLVGGATQIVPITVAGLSNLPDTWDVSLEMYAQPNGGETIEIATDTQLNVQDGALSLHLETSDFVRGAKANIRFELDNTGVEAIQLITARNTGRNDSPDVTFTLVDEDDNVLALSPFRQAVGDNVITNASAETIATIAAGERWQSPETQITIPVNAPDEVYVVATINHLYANRGLAEQVRVNGPVVRQRIVLEETTYVGTVDSVTPARSFGDEPIVIQGQAIDRATNTPLANVDLTIVVTISNYERQFRVQTDDVGNYELNYRPQKGESGRYRISALNPVLTTRPTHGEFVINSISLSPERLRLNIPYLFDYSLPVTLVAGEGTELSNVRFELRAEDQPTNTLPEGLSIQLPPAISISSNQRRSRTLQVHAQESAVSDGQIFVALFANESSDEPLALLDIVYRLSQPTPGNVARPIVSHTPSVMEMGATLDGVSNRSITLENKGLATLRNVNLSFKTTDGFAVPSWIKLVTPQNLGDIEAGESKTIDLVLRPDNAAPVGVTGFNLEVQSSNAQNYLIPVYASVSESGRGGVLLKVTDMYTGVLNGSGSIIQGLPSAEVRIQNEALPNIDYRLTTDSLGEVFVESIPAGRYSIWVSEPNYQEAHIRVRVQPGLIESEQVFLDYNLINLEWSVNEITIEDSYQVTLKATFETDVPAAVVMLEPTSIPLPAMDVGEVFYGELKMTNYGLIRAYDIDFTPQESDEFFQFDYFIDVVPESLDPKEVVIIPYKITALKSLEQQDASGGGCGVYNNCSGCNAKSFCPTGISETSTRSCVTRSYGSCGRGGGGIPSRPTYSGGGGGGGGSGAGAGDVAPTAGFPVCRDGGAGCGQ